MQKLATPSPNIAPFCPGASYIFGQLSHTIHWDEYLEYKKAGELLSKDAQITPSINRKVVWFTLNINPEPNEHNKYGNVSFYISMEKLAVRFASYYLPKSFNLLDRNDGPNEESSSWLLWTRETIGSLAVVDLNSSFSPLQFSSGKWIYNSKYNFNLPSLEIALDVTGMNINNYLRSLYEQSIVVAVNHCDAVGAAADQALLTTHRNACQSYNFYGHACPTPYSKFET
ncbi:uncharacterized protein LOC108669126 [Hyalella azteca]|uniref:Uncharacterized protein LOC108669126 n=1 Tax=Hyalella azteca TaxID=294128 RepID=A0A8B7NE78_HYAAZ|nr:uncharacterized protein LOC108669126 [Hyalella azteca]XP_018011906.1 uncharacterized protein LOC108669126 [Hyalella azteca]XP_018011907.1 uncharacterized protein LOC108669126 [Hyalella azteca]XP_018011908.1 uncharacterized protein LOC108669126 [Hyalella azteca]XP_018011909.1 uncharacterized protein LOC108669126 [Hyalella azteca]XP_018011910.1 uncharacterized protein LOC108669126 [Hyalella azteca]XP_018011913.1 uncharacterized protein LOC108669126 [Hyalella azteca]